MQAKNYQREMEKTLQALGERVPTLLLHSCCAPCSSYVIEYLSAYFAITVFYYNPNIYPDAEYAKRVIEQQRFLQEFPAKHPLSFVEGAFEPARFYAQTQGMADLPEGGERCKQCFALRLGETAKMALQLHAEYFATTLTVSPLKNAAVINQIGMQLQREYGVRYLESDFKKRNGYQRSVTLSRMYGLYRQDYCGCVFSQQQRRMQQEAGKEE